MLYLTQGSTNTIYVTCREKEVLTSPSYLIKWHHPVRKVSRYSVHTDSSDYPNRHQKLTVVETTSPTASTNQANLNAVGFWHYYIYEYTGTAPTVETGLTKVEEGISWIKASSSTSRTAYESYQSSYVQYNASI